MHKTRTSLFKVDITNLISNSCFFAHPEDTQKKALQSTKSKSVFLIFQIITLTLKLSASCFGSAVLNYGHADAALFGNVCTMSSGPQRKECVCAALVSLTVYPCELKRLHACLSQTVRACGFKVSVFKVRWRRTTALISTEEVSQIYAERWKLKMKAIIN